MSEVKYKVGDKVIIISEYPGTPWGMKHTKGSIRVISEIREGHVFFEGFNIGAFFQDFILHTPLAELL